MIRHAGLDPATPIPALAIPMIESPFEALLMTAIGAPSLVKPRILPTGEATVVLAPITAGAQKKLGAAFPIPANPPSKAILRCRHAHGQAALDNDSSFVAG